MTGKPHLCSPNKGCLNKTCIMMPAEVPRRTGRTFWAPLLDEELQSINACLMRENWFSSGMSPQIGSLVPVVSPKHMYIYATLMNSAGSVYKTIITLKEVINVRGLGGCEQGEGGVERM